MKIDEIKLQREYYSNTANSYDLMCAFDPNDEHFIASAILSGLLNHYDISSLLDIGCGTGRALNYLINRHHDITFSGVEPVPELREVAIQKGINREILFEGDACNLNFADNQFDCVTMFGILHHIPNPEKAILEAIRVSKKIIFISDHNVYGMGSRLTKTCKQTLRDLRLNKLLNFLLTKGKGYHDTSWDGIFYPFSLLDYYELIKSYIPNIYVFPTKTPAINLYRNASHVAIFGVKDNTVKHEIDKFYI